MSPREYAALHKYVLSRSKVLRKRAPSVAVVQKGAQGHAESGGKASGGRRDPGLLGTNFNARAVRHALRVFVVGVLGMKAWEVVSRKLLRRESEYVAIPLHALDTNS